MLSRKPRTAPRGSAVGGLTASVAAGVLILAVMVFWPASGGVSHGAGVHLAARLTAVRLGSAAPVPQRPPGQPARVPGPGRNRNQKIRVKRSRDAKCITVPGQAEAGQTWIAGFANVTKLRGAALVGPAFANIVLVKTETICPNAVIFYNTEIPDYHGLPQFPPVRATFLAFGFMPVTSTIQLSQVGVGKIYLSLVGAVPGNPYVVKAVARRNIKVLSLKANGVTLPAGPRCEAVRPATAVLTNVNPTGKPGLNYWYTTTGGPLSGTITISKFADCGTGGDNLDPILDASISGVQNFTKLIQGIPCIFRNIYGSSCPPTVPKPRR